jgi:hypothetical protein
MIKSEFEKLKKLDYEFFELDDANKIAYMKLEFSKPSDIFDKNSITKTPMLSDDFIDWVHTSFDYTPRKYKLNLDVAFDDMEGYAPEQLKAVFDKNIGLEFKKIERKALSKNKVAFCLIGIGVAFLLAMLLITHLWSGESVAKSIFTYVFDIATTVTIWEAMTILVVESKERRSRMNALAKRIDDVNFSHKK